MSDTEAEARELLDHIERFPAHVWDEVIEVLILDRERVAHVTEALSRAHAAGKAEGERIGEAKGLRRAATLALMPGRDYRLGMQLNREADELEGKEGT